MTVLMLDIETTGTKPGCKILQIGAAMLHGPTFSIFISPNSQPQLVSEPNTLKWWLSQPEELQKEMLSGTATLTEALTEFNSWIQRNRLSTGIKVWGNGADFDKPILEAAMASVNISPLWSFTGGRCFRTLKNIFKGHEVVPTTKHNALEDAKAQLETLRRIAAAHSIPSLLV